MTMMILTMKADLFEEIIMINKKEIRYIVGLLCYIFVSAVIASGCPSFDNKSDIFLTQNLYGGSTYNDKVSIALIKKIKSDIDISSLSPALDIGAGYGAFTYNALKSGIKKLYINDLSLENLSCAKQYIKNNFNTENVEVIFFAGDINQNEIISKIPDNSIMLANAGNVIHFFSFSLNFLKKCKPKKNWESDLKSDLKHLNILGDVTKFPTSSILV